MKREKTKRDIVHEGREGKNKKEEKETLLTTDARGLTRIWKKKKKKQKETFVTADEKTGIRMADV
jgi:hypothetical protein